MRPRELVALEWVGSILYGVLVWALFTHKGAALPSLVGTVAAVLGLGLVRRAPGWATFCCLVPLVLTSYEPSLGFVAVPVLCLAMLLQPGRRAALIAAEVGVVATGLPDFQHAGGVLPFGLLVLGAWIAGRVARQFRRQAQELALQQERLRIARELHDIVAHSMSVITVQAGYGHLIIDDHPEESREALATIERTGRTTLAELRRLLGVLRSDEQVALAPAPSLRQLDELIAQTAKAGVRAELRVVGAPVELAAGLELSAYRIVQEALTNVVKHASTPSATVAIDYRPDELVVEIIDRGEGSAFRAGHGLIGLRERVALYDGTFDAGPLPDKGFRVHARLPLGGAG
ncbi:histidine kinase [Kribbella sp. NPDC026611]|uniref:sensor histidine kinase n=1 Tax=Kribbella sp. NPDC026611 TaxID=3154911 RepID=UPI0033D3FBE7